MPKNIPQPLDEEIDGLEEKVGDSEEEGCDCCEGDCDCGDCPKCGDKVITTNDEDDDYIKEYSDGDEEIDNLGFGRALDNGYGEKEDDYN